MRLISDVPLGAFLSGGIDSSLIVALMARAGAGRVKTFSIGFEAREYNELEHASRVARHCGTDHQQFIVTPDAVSILPKLVWHYNEPYADSSAIPTWYLSELTRQIGHRGADGRRRRRELRRATTGTPRCASPAGTIGFRPSWVRRLAGPYGPCPMRRASGPGAAPSASSTCCRTRLRAATPAS